MTDFEPLSSTATHTFVSVLRGHSAVRLAPDESMVLREEGPLGIQAVTVRTRYMPHLGTGPGLPRELWFEVVGPGSDLPSAMATAFAAATAVKSIISIAMNAHTEGLQVERAFDGCDHHNDHSYFQNMLGDETGIPRLTRRLDVQPFLQFAEALLSHPRRDPLFRAIAQYELAIEHWIPGEETLALAHLYMAMEALTPVARDEAIEEAGGKDALIAEWGLVRRKCSNCDTSYGDGDLDANVRSRILFRGERDVYSDARKASDGFEHGFLHFGAIHTHATRHRERLGYLVRQAIMDLVEREGGWRDTLLRAERDQPAPAVRHVKYVRAVLLGSSAKLAPSDHQYPGFSLESSLGDVSVSSDGAATLTPTETFTKHLGDGIALEDFNYELIAPGPPSPKPDLGIAHEAEFPGVCPRFG